jgi:hypothetical protein
MASVVGRFVVGADDVRLAEALAVVIVDADEVLAAAEPHAESPETSARQRAKRT